MDTSIKMLVSDSSILSLYRITGRQIHKISIMLKSLLTGPLRGSSGDYGITKIFRGMIRNRFDPGTCGKFPGTYIRRSVN